MQLYLYSAQDLILDNNTLHNIKADNFYGLEINQSEAIKLYPTQSAGIMLINYDILSRQCHNQIIYHQLNDNALLCEIKPFISTENAQQYNITGGNVRLVQHINELYIYFNGEYYGCIKQKCVDIKFEKFNKHNQEYGAIFLGGNKKYLILFTSGKMLFCGQYVDYEILTNYIQIYRHVPNIFNVGNLTKYNFETAQFEHKTVRDKGDDKVVDNKEFNIISFLEAIKCGRYKYAYKKLSYELKSEINIEVLMQYFKAFDEYCYINEQNRYVTLYNHKVVGSCSFDTKDNMIDNIY